MAHQLSDSERRDWLRLSRPEHVGSVTFQKLIARFGSASAALEEMPRMASRGGGKNFALPDAGDAEREIAELVQLGGRMIAACEAEFPRGLAALEAPPPLISVLGHPHLLQKEIVAIVGARNASALARKFTDILSRDLGFAGIVVASGLARGIDASAHEAALAVGTVAVVAGGVDIIYPPENEKLYAAIKKQGVIISEMRLGDAPQAHHFPRRNRIISGLARGVVVVEAAVKSGSLISAQYALDQGREVFAVPGSPLDPRAWGTNRLIRDGATLTEGAEDILAVLRPMLGGHFGEPGETEGDGSPPLRSGGVGSRSRPNPGQVACSPRPRASRNRRADPPARRPRRGGADCAAGAGTGRPVHPSARQSGVLVLTRKAENHPPGTGGQIFFADSSPGGSRNGLISCGKSAGRGRNKPETRLLLQAGRYGYRKLLRINHGASHQRDTTHGYFTRHNYRNVQFQIVYRHRTCVDRRRRLRRVSRPVCRHPIAGHLTRARRDPR